MLSEASLQVAVGEIPIVLPRNFVQLILQILIVLPLDIENSVVGTTRWPLK